MSAATIPTPEVPETSVVPVTGNESALTPERKRKVLARLAEPFDPAVISWKPQVTSYKDPENPKAKGAAYADQRAYSDRLNEIFGADGWTREYTVYTASGVDRVTKSRQGEDKVVPNQAKVFVVAKVVIHGFGAHSGTGESWIDDDNAFTSAEAQAFKRACVCFGLGRYLYDLPETEWLPIDKYSKQFKVAPALPAWALPKQKCESCLHPIEDRTINRVKYTGEQLIKRSRDLYNEELCADCQIERARAAKATTSATKAPAKSAEPKAEQLEKMAV